MLDVNIREVIEDYPVGIIHMNSFLLNRLHFSRCRLGFGRIGLWGRCFMGISRLCLGGMLGGCLLSRFWNMILGIGWDGEVFVDISTQISNPA